MRLNFDLDSLCFWPPLQDAQTNAAPALPMVPAMQRRRMSALCKATLHAAFNISAVDMNAPLVFASRYGDMARSIELLEQLCAREALSPTQFSLSVHNAMGALHSILSGHTGQYTAVSAGEETIEAAIFEALSMLQDGAGSVRLIVSDEPLPAPYDTFVDAQPSLFSWGASVKLAAPGAGISLAPAAAMPKSEGGLWQFISGQTTQYHHDCGSNAWRWQRHG